MHMQMQWWFCGWHFHKSNDSFEHFNSKAMFTTSTSAAARSIPKNNCSPIRILEFWEESKSFPEQLCFALTKINSTCEFFILFCYVIVQVLLAMVTMLNSPFRVLDKSTAVAWCLSTPQSFQKHYSGSTTTFEFQSNLFWTGIEKFSAMAKRWSMVLVTH